MIKTIDDVKKVIKQGPYKDTWESLQTKKSPEWFKTSKFGIFIHWGLYSIPAFNNEWYPRNMYIENSEEFLYHVKTYGKHKDFGYKDFIPLFKAEKFDADFWAKTIKESGAKYTLTVAEHHDGFQMYKSNISKWNTYEMGPKKDILKMLKDSFEKANLKFGASSHRAEHWFFLSHGRKFESDIGNNLEKGDFYWPSEPEQHNYDFSSKPQPNKEFLEDWLLRTIEIIDNYNPSILYFDWWVQHEAFKPYLKMLAAYYYNVAEMNNQEVVLCYKHDAMIFGSGIMEIERGKFATIKHFPWQTETSIANNSWCYTNNLDYKSTYEIITLLIDVLSKNGNLLLNIGPKGNGEIPEYEINTLKEIGKWLKINGEAIYNSKPYLVFGEGDTVEKEGMFSEQKVKYTNKDFRFTVNNGSIYVFVLNPTGLKYTIKSLRKADQENHNGLFSKITKVKALGESKIKHFSHENDGLIIELENNNSNLPIVFKVELM